MPIVLLFLAAGTGLVLLNKIVNLKAGQPYLFQAGIYPPIPEDFFPTWSQTVSKTISDAYDVHLENRSMSTGLFSKKTVTMVWYKWVPNRDMTLHKGQALAEFGDSYGMTFIDAVPLG